MSKRWTDINESLEDVRNQNDAYSFDSDMNDLDIHFSISEAISFAAESKYIAEGLYRDMFSFNKKAEEKGYDTMAYIAEAFSIGGIFKRIFDFLHKIWSSIVNFFKGLFSSNGGGSSSGGSSSNIAAIDKAIKKNAEEIVELSKTFDPPSFEYSSKKINKLEMESNVTSLKSIANMSKTLGGSKKLNDHILTTFKDAMYKYINSDGTLKDAKFNGKILTSKDLIGIFDSRLKLLMGVAGLLVTDFTEMTDENESKALSMKSTRKIINELTKIINTGKFNGNEKEYSKLIKFNEGDVVKEILKMIDIKNDSIKDIDDLIRHIHKSIKLIEHDVKITDNSTSDISYYMKTVIEMSEHLDNHMTQTTNLIKDIGVTASDILKDIDEFKKTINNIATNESSMTEEHIDKLNMMSAGIIRIQNVIQELVLSFPRSIYIVYRYELNYICEKADFLKAFIRDNLKKQ